MLVCSVTSSTRWRVLSETRDEQSLAQRRASSSQPASTSPRPAQGAVWSAAAYSKYTRVACPAGSAISCERPTPPRPRRRLTSTSRLTSAPRPRTLAWARPGMPTELVDLPLELLSQLLAPLVSRRDLISAALVCRAWRPTAQQLLLRHVRLFGRDLVRPAAHPSSQPEPCPVAEPRSPSPTRPSLPSSSRRSSTTRTSPPWSASSRSASTRSR